MTSGNFVPFGGDLGNQSTASFVHTSTGTPVDNTPSEIAPVTPAEANDLPGQIHQILQDHLSGESLANATAAIQSAVSAAPARVALPEIKLASAPATEDVAGNEGEGAPPVLEYEREDDVVQRVIVNCSCGRSIPLDCSY